MKVQKTFTVDIEDVVKIEQGSTFMKIAASEWVSRAIKAYFEEIAINYEEKKSKNRELDFNEQSTADNVHF